MNISGLSDDGQEVYLSRVNMRDTCMFLAHSIAQLRSKDPRSKVGACLYDPKTGGYYLGYNGFPSGFPDLKRYWDNRDLTTEHNKYIFSRHAEVNAIHKARVSLRNLDNTELFVTHFPCRNCTRDFIVDSGIKTVYYATDTHFDAMSVHMIERNGIKFLHYPLPKIKIVYED